jgi:hypothetical protein
MDVMGREEGRHSRLSKLIGKAARCGVPGTPSTCKWFAMAGATGQWEGES